MKPVGTAWFVNRYVRVLVRSSSDVAFAHRLVHDPRTALAECGLETTTDVPVRLVRSGHPHWDFERAVRLWLDTGRIELPHPMDDARLVPDDELGDLAGGRLPLAGDLAGGRLPSAADLASAAPR